MDHAAVAQLKSALVGVDLPAEKAMVLEYAVRQKTAPTHLNALRSLPDREYESLDEIAEALLHVQPGTFDDEPPAPHEESGLPPGGDDYTTTHPGDTGRVRDLDKIEGS